MIINKKKKNLHQAERSQDKISVTFTVYSSGGYRLATSTLQLVRKDSFLSLSDTDAIWKLMMPTAQHHFRGSTDCCYKQALPLSSNASGQVEGRSTDWYWHKMLVIPHSFREKKLEMQRSWVTKNSVTQSTRLFSQVPYWYYHQLHIICNDVQDHAQGK